jgi:hypothetical protein
MEVWVRSWNSLVSLGRTALLAGSVAGLAFVLPAVTSAATITPTSLTDCGGKVSADPSGKAAGEPNLLDYRFQCDGGISAYTVLISQQGDKGGSIDDYNPSPSVFETDGLTPSATESITCEGTTPSNGINCAGAAKDQQVTDGFVVQGTVDPIQAYCKHLPTDANGKLAKPGTAAVPQAVVQLVVTDYTGAEDGPFNLGPAKACPKVANAVPAPPVKTKPKAKSKPKPKAAKAKRKASSKKRS